VPDDDVVNFRCHRAKIWLHRQAGRGDLARARIVVCAQGGSMPSLGVVGTLVRSPELRQPVLPQAREGGIFKVSR